MIADSERACAWFCLPGATEPTEAAQLTVGVRGGRWHFLDAYLERDDAISPDPQQLPLTSKRKGIAIQGKDGLPGVVRDATPAGYGADRTETMAGVPLSSLHLLAQPNIRAVESEVSSRR